MIAATVPVNAADDVFPEIAVAWFLHGKIGFLDISAVVADTLERIDAQLIRRVLRTPCNWTFWHDGLHLSN